MAATKAASWPDAGVEGGRERGEILSLTAEIPKVPRLAREVKTPADKGGRLGE